MDLDTSAFTIHDVSEFPFVVFNQGMALPGYAAQWKREMVTLLQFGKPFVVVYDQARTEENLEARKHRGIWLKENKIALSHVCMGLISIEPDDKRRAQAKAMSEIAMKAFGIRQDAVASRDAAIAMAHELTKDARQVRPAP